MDVGCAHSVEEELVSVKRGGWEGGGGGETNPVLKKNRKYTTKTYQRRSRPSPQPTSRLLSLRKNNTPLPLNNKRNHRRQLRPLIRTRTEDYILTDILGGGAYSSYSDEDVGMHVF